MEEIEWGNAVPSKGPPRGLGEVFSDAITDAKRVSNLNANYYNLNDAYDEINGRIKSATGKDLANPLHIAAPTDSGVVGEMSSGEGLEPLRFDPVADWKRQVGELRTKFPQAMSWDGLEDAPQRMADDRMRSIREASDAARLQSGLISRTDIPYIGRVPVVGDITALGVNLTRHPAVTTADFLGGMVGQAYSPADAMANLMGFGAGKATESILKTALKNAAANAAMQAPLSAIKQSDYKRAGLPYGWDVWLAEVEGAAAMGGVLDAGVRGAGRPLLRRFGRDTPAETMLSRHTERAGWLTDIAKPLDLPEPPVVRSPVSKEIMDRARQNDPEALRTVADKMGVGDDPVVKGALDYLETHGTLDEATIASMKALGVDTGEGLRILERAVRDGARDVRMPDPVPAAAAPLDVAAGRTLLAERGDKIDALLGTVDPRMARMVRDGVEAGIPDIIKALSSAETPEDLAKGLSDIDRLSDLVALHALRDSPVGLAAILRRRPDLVDTNLPLHAEAMRQARSIAALDAAAFERAAQGDIPAPVVSLVSDMVSPPQQARVLADLAKAGIADTRAARAALPDLIERPAPEAPLDGGSTIKEPNDAAAKADTQRLREENAAEVAVAMAPIEARRQVESRIEQTKGEIAGLEARQDAELGREPAAPEATPDAPRNPVADAVAAGAEALGLDPEAMGVRSAPETPKAAPTATEALIAKRAELRAETLAKADLDTAIDGTPPIDPALRLVLESAAIQRGIDVRRAVHDALRLADRMLPPDAKVRIESTEMRDPVTNVLVEGTSDPTSGEIALAAYALNPAARLGHEGLHTLITRGLIRPEEVTLLDQAARAAGAFAPEIEARYREAYAGRPNLDGLIAEESAAHLIEAVVAGKVAVPVPTGVMDRIRMMVARVRNALHGYGFRTFDDVVKAVLEGHAARRTAHDAWMRSRDLTAADVKPDGSLFAFAGERAKTADIDALAEAKKMESDGTPREDIWSKTGWFKGVDGKWRFEIDDSGQRLKRPLEDLDKVGRPMPSDLVFQHDKLHEAYPQVGDIPWYRTPEMEAGGGSYDPVRGIRIGSGHGFASGKSGPGGMTLHEQQHALQGIEDFARGGSREYGHPIADVKREAQAAYEANRAHQQSGVRTADDELLAALGLEPPKLTQEWSALTPRQQLDWYDAGRGRLYNKLAGEVEARTVQKRMDMTPEERRARPPWLDYDVPEDQQIVRAMQPKDDGTLFALSDERPVTPGLDMSPEARKQRAQEMGFDTEKVWYHGSDAEFDAFMLGQKGRSFAIGRPGLSNKQIFLTDDRAHAEVYGEPKEYYIRGNYSRDDISPMLEEWARDAEGYKSAQDMIDSYGDIYSAANLDDHFLDQANKARNSGQDGAITSLGGLEDPTYGFSGSIAQVFDPKNIRSVNAAFDPAHADSPNLLYAMRSDLDMSPEARKQRAEAMGFDTGRVWYHGTDADFSHFKSSFNEKFPFAAFFADDQVSASEYAMSKAKFGGRDPNVIPSYVRAQKIVDYDARGKRFDEIAIDDLAIKAAGDGYDALRVKNVVDPGGDTERAATTLVVFDPKNIRSVNAAFDPARADSPNLLYAMRPEQEPEPPPPLHSEMAILDKLSRMTDLIAACR